MKKSLAAWIFLLAATLACNLLQPEPQDVPPLVFPDSAPTYTPVAPFAPNETAVPLVVTATPLTPSPTPGSVTLQKLGQWRQPEAFNAFWSPKLNWFGVASPTSLSLYETATQQKRWESAPEGKDGLFRAVTVSPNGKFIINFNLGPALHVLDVADGALLERKRALTECDAPNPLQSVYLNNGLKELFTASQANQITAPIKIHKWAIAPYGCELIASVNAGPFAALLLSPDEKFLVLSTSSGLTGRVIAWNSASGQEACAIDGAAAAFHRDGRLAVADMQANELVYWRLDSCQVSSRLPWVGYNEPQAMAFTPDGKYLLTFRQGIQVWDAKTASLLLERTPAESAYRGLLRPSPDGKYLLTILNPGSPNALLEIWEIGDK